METKTFAILYRRDVMQLAKCSAYVARNLMRETGNVFTVGNKYAVREEDLIKVLESHRITH